MYALELEDYKSQNRLRELYEEYRLKEMLAEASANIDVRAQKELLPLKKR